MNSSQRNPVPALPGLSRSEGGVTAITAMISWPERWRDSGQKVGAFVAAGRRGADSKAVSEPDDYRDRESGFVVFYAPMEPFPIGIRCYA